MPAHPLSFRRTREAARASAEHVAEQGTILNQHAAVLDAHSQALTAAGAVLGGSLWLRLRWLVTGR